MKKLNKNSEYWGSVLKRYRLSKIIRKYLKKHRLSYSSLTESTGYSRQYIYGIEQITIKPSAVFINKLIELGIIKNGDGLIL